MAWSIALYDGLLLALPDWSVFALGALTQLGDGWFVVLLFAVALWRYPERRPQIGVVIGATLVAVGAYGALKHFFAFPRPAEPLAADVDVGGLGGLLIDATATAGGYSFPSGHATTVTTVYVGLATALRVGTRVQRYAAAAAIVVLVAFTRVALIVHYVVDVVAGTALGLLVLGGALWLARRSPTEDGVTPVLALSVAVSVVYAAASGGAPKSIALFGVSGCALAAWLVTGSAEEEFSSTRA